MIRLGTALKSTEPPYHRCLVISDVENNGGEVLLVRLTTDDGTWPDRDCILGPRDWIELDRDSTVAYSTCKYGRAVTQLENAVRCGWFEFISSPPPSVMQRIVAAARAAAGMPPAAKRLLPNI